MGLRITYRAMQWVKGSGANGVKGKTKGQYPMASFGANGANAAVSSAVSSPCTGARTGKRRTQLTGQYPIGQSKMD